MNKVTFKKNSKGSYTASTGETIEYLTSTDWAIADTNGWYITEVTGDFTGNRFATLADAKMRIVLRYNAVQHMETVLAKAEKTLAKYNASKVGA